MNENEIIYNNLASLYFKININKVKLIKDLKIKQTTNSICIYDKNYKFEIYNYCVVITTNTLYRVIHQDFIYLIKDKWIYSNDEISIIINIDKTNCSIDLYFDFNYNKKRAELYYDSYVIKTYNYFYISNNILITIYQHGLGLDDDDDYYLELDDKIYFINNYKLYFFI